MPATCISEQKMVFNKLHGKLMKNTTNAAFAGRGEKNCDRFLLPNSVVCQVETNTTEVK